jgi:hypothetical protein
MKTALIPSRIAPLLFGALVAWALPSPVAAQQAKAEVSSLEFDNLPSPDLGGTKNKSFKPKDWLEVEAGFKIPPMNREQQETGFIDQVVVKWYVAIKENASKKVMLLTKDVTHINIPVDEEVFTSVYLSPNTLKRLTGSDRASKSAVEVVGLEILVNGVKVGEETSKMKGGWWNSPNLGRGDRFPLLDKSETPFKNHWWDRYAEIQEKR